MCGGLSLDITVYLGQILKNLGKTVLIADMTKSCGLNYLFSVSKKLPVTYQGVDYADLDFCMNESCFEEYDYVFFCAEKNLCHIGGNIFSYLYYISDMEYAGIRVMLEEIKKNRLVSGVILRDIPENGIQVDYLLKYVFCDDYLFYLCNTGKLFEIADDLIDREYRIHMQYSDFCGFHRLSEGYLKVLEKIAEEITNIEPKIVKKALKRAKEGKNIEQYKHSVLEQRVRKKCYQH